MYLQGKSWRSVQTRMKIFILEDIPSFRNDLLVIMSAGYLGVVGAALLVPAMLQLGVDLSLLPAWVVLIALVWALPIFGQIGANPILTVSVLAPLLPAAEAFNIGPASFAVALLCGWTMAGLTSPFTATNALVARLGNIKTSDVGRKWNRSYCLVAITLLSIWAVLFAYLTAV
jgi:TRAP-type C4-dicarboxylate transport system permease large subunit